MDIPINLLIKNAKTSSHKQHLHSTLILRGGKPVSYASNKNFHHSEVRALNKLWPSKREKVTIINIRIRRNGTIGLSKPCERCMKYLRKNKVGRIWYSVSENVWEML